MSLAGPFLFYGRPGDSFRRSPRDGIRPPGGDSTTGALRAPGDGKIGETGRDLTLGLARHQPQERTFLMADECDSTAVHRFRSVSGFAPVDEPDYNLCATCALPREHSVHSTKCPKDPRCVLIAGHDTRCAMALR